MQLFAPYAQLGSEGKSLNEGKSMHGEPSAGREAGHDFDVHAQTGFAPVPQVQASIRLAPAGCQSSYPRGKLAHDEPGETELVPNMVHHHALGLGASGHSQTKLHPSPP